MAADVVAWHSGGNIEFYGTRVFSKTELRFLAGGEAILEGVKLRSSVAGRALEVEGDAGTFFSGKALVPHCNDAPTRPRRAFTSSDR